MKYVGIAALTISLLAAVTLIAAQWGLLSGHVPSDPGVKNGRLNPPSLTPNSVSSQASLYPDHPQHDYARIEPFRFTGDADAAFAHLRVLLETAEQTQVVRQEGDYLYAVAQTRWLKFTDDMEFWLDREQHVIHVRSASRLGRKDFGTNRARMESLRARW